MALAQRVQELSRYRSDFFGRLRAILGNRPDIRIVGDRFVFQSEVFDTGKATLDKPEGRAELDALASALLELEKKIPGEIACAARRWAYRRTADLQPAVQEQLGALRRARDLGRAVPHQQGRVAATAGGRGFGEFQPIDADKTEEAFSRNRRIELKLTER